MEPNDKPWPMVAVFHGVCIPGLVPSERATTVMVRASTIPGGAIRQRRFKRQERWVAQDIDDESGETFDEFDPCVDRLPYVREEPKIGRNEPCPCGSGG